MSTITRCKFKLKKVEHYENDVSGLKFEAVVSGSKENEQFFRWTPSASLDLQTVNTKVAQQFTVGKEYYLDIVAAE